MRVSVCVCVFKRSYMHKQFWVSGVSLGLCPSTEHRQRYGEGGFFFFLSDGCEECIVLRAMTGTDWGDQTGSDMETPPPPKLSPI